MACQDANVDVAHAPAALRKRWNTWSRLQREHEQGSHHPLLCATPASCAAYGRVIHTQLSWMYRALQLPRDAQEELAESLDQPGLRSLGGLIAQAECNHQALVGKA